MNDNYKTITLWNEWCLNYDDPEKFISYMVHHEKGHCNMQHLMEKFDCLYDKYGNKAVMLMFWCELDSRNREILVEYITKEWRKPDDAFRSLKLRITCADRQFTTGFGTENTIQGSDVWTLSCDQYGHYGTGRSWDYPRFRIEGSTVYGFPTTRNLKATAVFDTPDHKGTRVDVMVEIIEKY